MASDWQPLAPPTPYYITILGLERPSRTGQGYCLERAKPISRDANSKFHPMSFASGSSRDRITGVGANLPITMGPFQSRVYTAPYRIIEEGENSHLHAHLTPRRALSWLTSRRKVFFGVRNPSRYAKWTRLPVFRDPESPRKEGREWEAWRDGHCHPEPPWNHPAPSPKPTSRELFPSRLGSDPAFVFRKHVTRVAYQGPINANLPYRGEMLIFATSVPSRQFPGSFPRGISHLHIGWIQGKPISVQAHAMVESNGEAFR